MSKLAEKAIVTKASSSAAHRLSLEYRSFVENPLTLITARPSEQNILDWNFLFIGAPDTPYAGGVYWGKIRFPPEYPFRPPTIRMITPSGRFAPRQALCLSMTNFHPERWSPAWKVSSILLGLLSFMSSPEEVGTGCVDASDATRRELALASHVFNTNDPEFCEAFPEYADKSNPPRCFDNSREQTRESKEQEINVRTFVNAHSHAAEILNPEKKKNAEQVTQRNFPSETQQPIKEKSRLQQRRRQHPADPGASELDLSNQRSSKEPKLQNTMLRGAHAKWWWQRISPKSRRMITTLTAVWFVVAGLRLYFRIKETFGAQDH